MRSNKNINFLVPLQVYPFDIMVSIDQTDEQLLKSVKKYGINSNDIEEIINLPKTVKGRTLIIYGTNQTFIRLIKHPKKPTDYNALHHEIFHAVDFILRKIGIKLSQDSDEAYAYLIGYVTEKIYEKLN